jgi:uncharacterized circularly permuted ATP-grasp superfamily protein/uncharacterized alpha-E superfamily protein
MNSLQSILSKGPESLLAGYVPKAGGFDELREPTGAMRLHWDAYFRQALELGQEEYARRWGLAARLNRENDVSYNANESELGLSTPWSIESLPHLIPATEWHQIESSISQRAAVLNQILGDLYGQQKLVRNGVIPAELIYSHPGFLRPVSGMKVPRKTFLHLYAADLAKGTDGVWRVMADRTQAPSGAGYVLENRIVVSRTYPEIFHGFQVRRLVGFFDAMRDMLHRHAPHNRDTPRIVLLTPGPLSETYFEHVYLARYLGIPLVEGADLTTRDNCVYLKTIGGLQLVDVVLRHVNDSRCDPLELRYDSHSGVPGLVQAAHAGNVTVINGLGSGIVGSYGFMSFLNDASLYFHGEALTMPSIPTFWCGRSDQLDHVLANLPTLAVKAAVPGTAIQPRFGPHLRGDQLEALKGEIRANPHLYVAQEMVPLATTPVWVNGRLEPRGMLLRIYLVSTEDGYMVMPGGMTRISGHVDSPFVSPKRGGSSKDTWVLSDQPIEARSLLQASQRILALSRSAADQHPSRVADNMYWLGRYVERLDTTLRLLRTILARFVSDLGIKASPELPALLRVLVDAEVIARRPKELDRHALEEWLEKELHAAVYDEKRPGSICAILGMLRRASWIVRDRLSNDSWRLLHRLDNELPLPTKDSPISLAEAYGHITNMILTIAGFSGLVMDSMTRGHTWRFLDIGRRLERSIAVANLLAGTLRKKRQDEAAVFQSVLEVADSSMTYRYRYFATFQFDAVLDLLITDEANPRSIAYQLAKINDHFDALPRDASQQPRSSEQRGMMAMLSELRMLNLADLDKAAADGRRRALLEVLDRFSSRLPSLSDTISGRYFTHTEVSQELGDET